MRVTTERLDIVAPRREVWRALLAGDIGPAIEGYPTQGDIVMAGLVVEGHIPAGEWGPWQVTECETGHIVGGVGFKGAPSGDGVVEIGYGLAHSARGRGLAVEAVRALVLHAFDRGASGVLAECDVDNVASRRVLERAGFTLIEAVSGIEVVPGDTPMGAGPVCTWWRCVAA